MQETPKQNLIDMQNNLQRAVGLSTKTGMKIHTLLRISCSVICVVFIIYGFLAANNEHTSLSFATELESLRWELVGVGDVDLPYSYSGKAGEEIVLQSKLPADIPYDYAIMYQSNYCRSEVYISENNSDWKLIGSYGDIKVLPMGNVLGNIRVIVPIEKSYASASIKIVITPVYSQNLDLPQVSVASKSEIKNYVFNANIWRVITCSFLATFALLAFAISIYQRVRNTALKNRGFLYYGIFVLLISLWLICSSDIPQFVTNQNEMVSMLSYLSLAAMGIAYMAFCRHALNTGKNAFIAMEHIGYFLPIINVLAFVFNIADPPQLILLTHIYMLAVAVVSFIFAVKGRKGGYTSKAMLVALIILIVAACSGLAVYYFAPTSGMDAIAFGGGFICFSIVLFSIILYQEIQFIEKSAAMEFYREMAYKDELTGIGNRAGLDLLFEQYEEKGVANDNVAVFMFDLNYLKKVNDSEGHAAGDALIIAAADCISTVFGRYGQAFRVGGDEFSAVIIKNGEEINIESILKEFRQHLLLYNENFVKHNPKPVSVSLGYAKGCYDGNDKRFMHSLFTEADERMYEDKEKFHKNNER